MLAGLIFATEEAGDRPGVLAATLPFGGMTLLEYQIRLLVGAGAGQVMVAVGRVTPALLGAVSRAARRGVPVDVVRSAEEAALKVHPLAHVLVMADGLVTIEPAVAALSEDGDEALLVTEDPASPAAVERLDMRYCWAGLARIPAHHLGAIARMPADYDFQSALLRVAVEAEAEILPLTAAWERAGHAVEHNAQHLAARSHAVLASLTERRASWADRWIFTPIARLALPEVVSRGVPGWSLIAGGVVVGAGAVAGVALGWQGIGLCVSLVALAALAIAGALAALRGEDRRAMLIDAITGLLALAAILAAGWRELAELHGAVPLVLAIVTVCQQALAERAPVRHRRWWSSPASLLVLLTPFALLSFVDVGLGVLAAYAFSTAAAAVEATREKA